MSSTIRRWGAGVSLAGGVAFAAVCGTACAPTAVADNGVATDVLGQSAGDLGQNELQALLGGPELANDAGASPAIDVATAADATGPDPTDLLGQTQTALNDANDALGQINATSQPDLQGLIIEATRFQDNALQSVDQLQTAEAAISANDGSFSGLANELLAPLNQDWYQAGESLLNADQALEAAVAAGSDTNTAVAGIGESVLPILLDVSGSHVVDFYADLLSLF